MIKMRISWLKAKDDEKSFKFQKNMGFDVYEIEDLEKTDNKINELVEKKYHTIILSNEIAGFSTDIIKKYSKSDTVNIIIANNKKEY